MVIRTESFNRVSWMFVSPMLGRRTIKTSNSRTGIILFPRFGREIGMTKA